MKCVFFWWRISFLNISYGVVDFFPLLAYVFVVDDDDDAIVVMIKKNGIKRFFLRSQKFDYNSIMCIIYLIFCKI